MVMESAGGETMAMGVKCTESMVSKSLDNIVGNLWQARQESSGSSMGNQSPRNGEDLSDGDPGSPEESNRLPAGNGDRGGGVRLKDPRDLLFGGNRAAAGKVDFLEKDEARSLLLAAGFPSLPSLEAFHQRQREFLSASSPQSLLASNNLVFPRPPSSQPPTPSSQSSSPVHQSLGSGSQQNWSFEEQFKQLYEIDDNPKRKEFLDELFTFMQKRGTPINRLPIMAKQVLDLYELFNLVIARGGLVEVINKKLWQEVIKGLGLPSSITSAAFTLRTQYTKYLYPLECHKKNLSNPNELQAAIEGNKREGRRTSYGTYPEMLSSHHHPGMHPSPLSPMSFAARSIHHQLNGGTNSSGGPHLPPMSRSPPSLGNGSDHLSALEMTRLALWKMYNQAGNPNSSDIQQSQQHPGLPVNLPNMPTDMFNHHHHQQHQADKAAAAGLNMHLAERHRALEDAAKLETERIKSIIDEDDMDEEEEEELEETAERVVELQHHQPEGDRSSSNPSGTATATSPLKKRTRSSSSCGSTIEPEDVSPRKRPMSSLPMPGANIKITSRGDGQGGDSSLVVSMEINGTTYQGVLFAQPTKNSRTS